VGFRGLREALGSTVSGGRFVFRVFAVLAEFIREVLVEGTRGGFEVARVRGSCLGRFPVLTSELIDHGRRLLTCPDNTVAFVARLPGVSRAVLYTRVPGQGAAAGFSSTARRCPFAVAGAHDARGTGRQGVAGDLCVGTGTRALSHATACRPGTSGLVVSSPGGGLWRFLPVIGVCSPSVGGGGGVPFRGEVSGAPDGPWGLWSMVTTSGNAVLKLCYCGREVVAGRWGRGEVSVSGQGSSGAPGVEHAQTSDVSERCLDLGGLLASLRDRSGRVDPSALARLPVGGLLGLPSLEDDVWVDIAGAAALAGVAPKTITGWLSRHGPVRKPFPSAHRYLYRLYWPAGAILAWRAAEDRT
jgi:hypothetical protein